MINPLTRCVQDYALPPFGSMRVEDIAPALRTAIDEMTLDVNSIEDDLADPDAEFTWESVMDRLEIIDDPLERLWQVVIHLTKVMSSPDLRAARAEMEESVLKMQTRRAQSTIIFEAMMTLKASAAYTDFSVEQKRVLDREIQRATLRGVHLADGARDRFNAIELRLTTLASEYSNNVLHAIKDYSLVIHDRTELDGLPDSALSLFAQNAVTAGFSEATAATGPWKLSLETPVTSRVQKYCSNRALRQEIYCASMAKASTPPHDNTTVVEEILQLRQEKARLLGFTSYAEFSLATKMAPSVAAVYDMIESLRNQSYHKSVVEVEKLQAYATAHGQMEPLAPWDVPFWSERLQKEQLDFDEETIKQYFPLQRVLQGMFEWVKRLFGIQIEAADGDEETWHSDVRFFRMRALDQPGTPVVAQFYLDLFSRPGEKKHGSWIEIIAGRSKMLRTEKFPVRVPVFCLVWNQTPPVGDGPSLMTFMEVKSLFHIFGYGLRTALTSANCTSASLITGVEWEAAEGVGKFAAHFCFNRETIQIISSHVDTGKPLPNAIFDKLVQAKRFMAATTLQLQLYYAAVDMHLYDQYDPASGDTILDVQHRFGPRFFAIPRAPEDRFPCWLYQIFTGSYAAGYYCYRWSDLIASDAYSAFEEAETEQAWAATGRRYRDTMYGLLGIHDPNQVFEMFRGRKPNDNAYLKYYGLEGTPSSM
ncbi:Aste57867_18377 [Aphanomyces stellatus]|uniref:oligopeptidase A n=1 Tax=Aphanomyces stellatus TaxID=120398 RepID=A0A485LBJ2_9STRA|nr:hypothetical protein As57867_018315 [Aphanomyces stellatus]VFT95113.1 Aste57867_18377 [Aphanomyces stellatus]